MKMMVKLGKKYLAIGPFTMVALFALLWFDGLLVVNSSTLQIIVFYIFCAMMVSYVAELAWKLL